MWSRHYNRSGAREFIPVFSGVGVARSFAFCVLLLCLLPCVTNFTSIYLISLNDWNYIRLVGEFNDSCHTHRLLDFFLVCNYVLALKRIPRTHNQMLPCYTSGVNNIISFDTQIMAQYGNEGYVIVQLSLRLLVTSWVSSNFSDAICNLSDVP